MKSLLFIIRTGYWRMKQYNKEQSNVTDLNVFLWVSRLCGDGRDLAHAADVPAA